MCRVNSDESVPEVPEHVQLKLGLDTQHKGVLLQLRIRGRLISLIFVEHHVEMGEPMMELRGHAG
jgi:hypothetical protein